MGLRKYAIIDRIKGKIFNFLKALEEKDILAFERTIDKFLEDFY